MTSPTPSAGPDRWTSVASRPGWCSAPSTPRCLPTPATPRATSRTGSSSTSAAERRTCAAPARTEYPRAVRVRDRPASQSARLPTRSRRTSRRAQGCSDHRGRAQRRDLDGLPGVRRAGRTSSVEIKIPYRRRWRPQREAKAMFSEQGLKDMQATLAADGYAMAAFEEGDQVVITIEAMPKRARTAWRRPTSCGRSWVRPWPSPSRRSTCTIRNEDRPGRSHRRRVDERPQGARGRAAVVADPAVDGAVRGPALRPHGAAEVTGTRPRRTEPSHK